MSSSRALYHMVRADFLERVRRYSFLLTLAFSIYLGYAVYSGLIVLHLGQYQGVNNSAWLGSVMGLVGSLWLTLVGFYIVKNTIQRDRQTRVGQILATTPISKGFYTVSKMLSNFAVLAAMAGVLALSAIVVQLSSGSNNHIDFVLLLSPIFIFALSSLAVTAALAVLFESLPVLRGGVGNVLYFFLWTFLIAFGASATEHGIAPDRARPFTDFTGIISVMSQMQSQVRGLDPQYDNGASFSIGSTQRTTKSFLWAGTRWTAPILLSRLMLLAVAFALALLAALFFDRFDPARASWLPQKKPKAPKAIPADALPIPQDLRLPKLPVGSLADGPRRHSSVSHLAPLARTGSRTRFFTMVVAEFKLLLRGHAWWWYLGAAGAFPARSRPLRSHRLRMALAPAHLVPTRHPRGNVLHRLAHLLRPPRRPATVGRHLCSRRPDRGPYRRRPRHSFGCSPRFCWPGRMGLRRALHPRPGPRLGRNHRNPQIL